jgi:hypothetical protein
MPGLDDSGDQTWQFQSTLAQFARLLGKAVSGEDRARHSRLHPLSCDFSATSLIAVIAKLRATSHATRCPCGMRMVAQNGGKLMRRK